MHSRYAAQREDDITEIYVTLLRALLAAIDADACLRLLLPRHADAPIYAIVSAVTLIRCFFRCYVTLCAYRCAQARYATRRLLYDTQMLVSCRYDAITLMFQHITRDTIITQLADAYAAFMRCRAAMPLLYVAYAKSADDARCYAMLIRAACYCHALYHAIFFMLF